MKAYKEFIISPIGKRYNNSTKIDDKELILNTEIFNHQFINRKAKVIATPLLFQSPLKVGDEVIVHHNIFRRWHDVKGVERNSRSYIGDNKYLTSIDQIFLYNGKAMPGFSFVKPIKSLNPYHYKLSLDIEQPLVGVIKYSDGTFNKEELVGFTPNSEYEFVINNERLYRVKTKNLTVRYEYKGKEKEYNPSWL